MGGGGSSNYSSSYTNPISNAGASNESGSVNDCDNLSFETRLQQIQLDALNKVEEGSVLQLRVPPMILRVEVLNYYGEMCGSIISPQLHTLIKCIENGNVYEAAVLEIRENVCKVLIQRSK